LNTDPNKIAGFVKQCNFGFLFAQKFHPAMAKVAPIRKELGVRTIFNVLGPLANPAQPKYMLAGSLSPTPLYVDALVGVLLT
jgi:anthranilate phosphoribosyltransferase